MELGASKQDIRAELGYRGYMTRYENPIGLEANVIVFIAVEPLVASLR